MFRLYEQYYDATSESVFLHDLDGKDYVIILTDRRQRLQGFTTLVVHSFVFDGFPLRAIFSGDTIIDHAYWGEQAMAYTWARLAGKIKAQQQDVPLYWFLVVKGHRTYRYLPAFSKRYYPAWKYKTPPRYERLIHYLATQLYGSNYCPESGLMRFNASRGHLKQEWAQVSEKDLQKPEVRFFLERNPGYVQGDELACITELQLDNLRPFAGRLFMEGQNL